MFLSDYVDLSDAQSLGLATVSGNNFFLRADDTTTLTNGAGRKSVRIQSQKQWDNHVSVYAFSASVRPLIGPNSCTLSYNVLHMPQGCGTWPAIWENGDNWPNGVC